MLTPGFTIGKTYSAAKVEAVLPIIPSGAIGDWYADQYQSTPRRVIPNSVATTPVSTNILLSPRRQFNQTAYWSNVGVTITDNGANGPLPSDVGQASVVAGSGAWYVSPGNTLSVPSGTYTVGLSVRWRGTGNPSFQLGNFGSLSTKTATGTWQRFSSQFTSSGGGIFPLMYADGGSSSGDFEIIDFEIFPGTVDLGTGAVESHMYLGRANLSVPDVSGGLLDCTSGGLATIQFPSSIDFSSGVTVAYVAKRTASGTLREFQPVFSNSQGGDWAKFSVGGDFFNTGAGIYAAGGFQGYPQQNGSLANYQGNDLACFVHRYERSKVDMYCNGQLLATNAVSFSMPSDLRDFFVSSMQFGQYFSGDKLNSLVVWNRGLSNQEVQDTNTALRARAGNSGLSIPTDRFVIFLGDSLGLGANGSPGYAYQYAVNASPRIRGVNLSIGGGVVATMAGLNATRVIPLIQSMLSSGSKVICHVNLGVNDMRVVSSDSFINDYAPYLDSLRAAGAKVAVNTCPPSTLPAAVTAGYESRRTVANTAIRSWVGTHIDAYCDIAVDPTVGPESAADDTDLYADKVHPTTLGHSHFESIIRPVLNSL